ncbi:MULTISPECIES: hypothetical protein [unclassified Oceanispirochaeta]|uniref:hypothetical protein n=1 Tax=unclassified Oceanispirochaeta TaxID=2635722 RepID=UPI000E093EA5|nr:MULTISPECIES: hypothetical protein [unclassified Oceanispirochaeta]MBF9016217.1 hypothetical protein [Oceanispirochaeta sp. M2]NPD72679.1 hypothetical protein [Oceanispirochaeta sp. M1]RDG31829.1 hypothetical protein DV872_11275 [Oceanispirochaeta sp. M1]
MNNKVAQRKSRLKLFFEDGREVDILVRSLARKLVREEKTELPASVLSQISGVSEELWIKTYSERRNFLNDLLTAPIQYAIRELKALEKEERNFIDKLTEVLRLIYTVNYTFPEVIILFHGIALDERLNEKLKVSIVMDQLIVAAIEILKKQAYIEEIIEKKSTMEKLLFFLIQQMMESLQTQLFDYCDDYIENRSMASFPNEKDMVDSLMAPIVEHLEGITAV